MSNVIRYRAGEPDSGVSNPVRLLRCGGQPKSIVVVQMVVEGVVVISREQYDLDDGKADSAFTFEMDHDGKTYRFDGVRPEVKADRVTFRFRCPA